MASMPTNTYLMTDNMKLTCWVHSDYSGSLFLLAQQGALVQC